MWVSIQGAEEPTTLVTGSSPALAELKRIPGFPSLALAEHGRRIQREGGIQPSPSTTPLMVKVIQGVRELAFISK